MTHLLPLPKPPVLTLLLACLCLSAPAYAPTDPSPFPPERTTVVQAAATAADPAAAGGEVTTGGQGAAEDGQPTRSTPPEAQGGEWTGPLGNQNESSHLPPGEDASQGHGERQGTSRPPPPPVLHVMPPALDVGPGEEASASPSAVTVTALPGSSFTATAAQRIPLAGPMSVDSPHTAVPPWIPPVHHGVHHHVGKSRFGPYFEEGAEGSNVTARLGSTVRLDCKIGMLQDKTVTWLHRKDDAIHLLTVGRQAYSSDSRFSLAYRYPSNWRLQILFVNRRDEGLYECQVATHPTRVRKVYLKVTAPQIRIVDENRHDVLERYYKVGSEVELTCLATQLEERDGLPELDEGVPGHLHKGTTPLPPTTTPRPAFPRKGFSGLRGVAARVLWRHGDSAITHNTNGRGLGVRVSAGGRNVALTLRIESVKKEDGGNYTCSIGTISSATVFIHILNGELPAAVQYGISTVPFKAISVWLQLFCLFLTCSGIWR